jgi:hypothetical protein
MLGRILPEQPKIAMSRKNGPPWKVVKEHIYLGMPRV